MVKAKEIKINDVKYELLHEEKDAFDSEIVTEKLTDYFDMFDVIVGDWSYGKLRLKGFNEKGNKDFKEINNVARIPEYIEKYCAYGCKWFEIKKIRK